MLEYVGTKRKREHEKITVKLVEINLKVLAKEGRLKRYRQRFKQYRRNRTFQTTKENSINNWEEMTIKHTNNQMSKKLKDLGLKYSNQKI